MQLVLEENAFVQIAEKKFLIKLGLLAPKESVPNVEQL
jgi:hypothetical protein